MVANVVKRRLSDTLCVLLSSDFQPCYCLIRILSKCLSSNNLLCCTPMNAATFPHLGDANSTFMKISHDYVIAAAP